MFCAPVHVGIDSGLGSESVPFSFPAGIAGGIVRGVDMASCQPIKVHTVTHGIPARCLAAVTGRSEAQISLVVSGKRRGSRELRRQLAAFLGMPVEALFDDAAPSS